MTGAPVREKQIINSISEQTYTLCNKYIMYVTFCVPDNICGIIPEMYLQFFGMLVDKRE